MSFPLSFDKQSALCRERERNRKEENRCFYYVLRGTLKIFVGAYKKELSREVAKKNARLRVCVYAIKSEWGRGGEQYRDPPLPCVRLFVITYYERSCDFMMSGLVYK